MDERITETDIRWSRPGRGVAALACLLVIARLPFLLHPIPAHPDELAFMAGLGFPQEYPVHAPGYPIWVVLGTITGALGVTAYHAYSIWSLVASVVGPVLLYVWLARRIDPGHAWWTAMAFGLCPLAWFHSVTAMTYWAATLAGLLIVTACVRGLAPDAGRARFAAALALSVGIYLRPDCAIYFGPLLVYVLWRRRNLSSLGCALLVCVAVAGFWLVMQAVYGRGGDTLFAERFGHSRNVLLGTSVFRRGAVDGLMRNLVKIGVNLIWNLAPLAAAMCAMCLLSRRPHGARRSSGGEFIAILLWLAPGLLFLALFHVVEGYFLWLLPGFYVGAALMADQRLAPRQARTLMMSVALASAAQFLVYPWSAESSGIKRTIDAKIGYLSAQGLRRIDQRGRIHRDGDVWPTPAHQRDRR